MFVTLLITIITSIFTTFFLYLHDSLNLDDESEYDINKYIFYFIIISFCIFSSLFLFNIFNNSDMSNMNVEVELPNF